MRPTNSRAISSRATWAWNSPVPYLFGGLALMVGLILVALSILACSYKKRALGSISSSTDQEKPVMATNAGQLADSRPKIVVIMAGDENPTYLATPVPPSAHPGGQHV
ncbi:hypothetical protein RJ640_026703 [Escallonia rubra]|uniref:Uncharacterized protein n=1 Tax=Escallonia rubra TaxID=112253 RepID=A0AA88UCY9_9ASTE|nr:hypothetical protein RJ640_026703 [Escallonia rubra]